MTKRAISVLTVLFALFVYANNSGAKDLVIRTEINGQVFLEPSRASEKNVLVKITDPTEHAGLWLVDDFKNALKSKGYTLTEDPNRADYTVQGNVVRFGQVEPEYLKAAYESPFGSKLRFVDKKIDPISSAVGWIARSAKGKCYAIIIDLKLSTKRNVASNRLRLDESRCRIITGTQGCREKAEIAMKQLKDELNNYILAYF